MSLWSATASLVAEALGALLAPDRCAACAAAVPMRTIFCPACAATVAVATFDARGGGPDVAAFAYGGAVAQAIAAFKYAGRPDLARPLAHLMRRALPALRACSPDLVVPVPLHPSRLAARGFNQAALLAAPVARDLAARFAPRALVRTRDTAAQASLDRPAREANVASAFVLRRGASVRGARVLIVDDVRTTGATLRACAAALEAGGAREVRTLVLARADRE
jgi:ComF family protein